MKFAEIPQRLNPLLHPPDPIVRAHDYKKTWCETSVDTTFQVINHTIAVEDLRGPDQKKTSCYDIDVEVDDTLKTQMNSFLLSTASQQEIQVSLMASKHVNSRCQRLFCQGLDNKIHETVENINSMKTNREFFLSFSKDPQLFINKWLISQSRGNSHMSGLHTRQW